MSAVPPSTTSALVIGVRVPPGTIWSRSGSRRLNSRSSATEKNVRSARSTARPAGSGIAASTSLPRRKHRNDFLGHPDWHTRRIVEPAIAPDIAGLGLVMIGLNHEQTNPHQT